MRSSPMWFKKGKVFYDVDSKMTGTQWQALRLIEDFDLEASELKDLVASGKIN